MSRAYSMSIEVSGHDPARKRAIRKAADAEWSFDSWDEFDGKLIASGDGSLGGGETEEQFAERLTLAAWRANRGYCRVEVSATCLEDLPCETHSLDEDDYQRLVAGKGERRRQVPGRAQP